MCSFWQRKGNFMVIDCLGSFMSNNTLISSITKCHVILLLNIANIPQIEISSKELLWWQFNEIKKLKILGDQVIIKSSLFSIKTSLINFKKTLQIKIESILFLTFRDSSHKALLPYLPTYEPLPRHLQQQQQIYQRIDQRRSTATSWNWKTRKWN